MTTCATCKHWDISRPDYDIDDRPLPYGRCASAESSDGLPMHPTAPVHPAYAMDASGYHASLRTLPTFGCNQHAVKPSTDEQKAANTNTAALVRPTMRAYADAEG